MDRFPKRVQQAIVDAVGSLADDPRPRGSRKLTGSLAGLLGLYRIRVGEYRVAYQIDDSERTVLIVRVGSRQQIY